MYIYLRTQIFEFFEQKRVEKILYKNERFKEKDLLLQNKYKKKDPYRISRDFLKRRGAPNIYMYGETPLMTMYKIYQMCELSSEDHLIELGAGRGRAALFLATYLGCRVVGYEEVATFVEEVKEFENERFKLYLGDMFAANFSKATAVYLYGTMLDDEKILELGKAFPKKVKIITVSYPLSNYLEGYATKKTFQGRFPWGKTDIFWNERLV